MLGRLGLKALAMSCVLMGATSAWAQEPLYTPQAWEQSGGDGSAIAPGMLLAGGTEPSVEGAPMEQSSHCTSCDFDPYAHYDETISRGKRKGLGWKFKRKLGLDGCEGCADCGSGDCGSGNCGSGNCGHGGHKWGHGGLGNQTNGNPWRQGLGAGDRNACDFECANCFHRFDFEKRIVLGFVHGNANKRASRVGYGDFYGAQVAAELLPFVVSDSDSGYLRWGGTFMFEYSNYEGNRQAVLTSALSGRTLSVNDGVTYSFILGPTVRHDFEICGIRFSPNATAGLVFDWTNIKTVDPSGTRVDFRTIPSFKYAGFDVGGYFRMMLDFPITDTMNIGVGGDFKFVSTDVMVRDDELRKHTGFLLTISHEF